MHPHICNNKINESKHKRSLSIDFYNADIQETTCDSVYCWGLKDTETDVLQGCPCSAICVQKSDGSLKSAIHNAYRISLRPSSMREPRHPLLKVFFSIRKDRQHPSLLPHGCIAMHADICMQCITHKHRNGEIFLK